MADTTTTPTGPIANPPYKPTDNPHAFTPLAQQTLDVLTANRPAIWETLPQRIEQIERLLPLAEAKPDSPRHQHIRVELRSKLVNYRNQLDTLPPLPTLETVTSQLAILPAHAVVSFPEQSTLRGGSWSAYVNFSLSWLLPAFKVDHPDEPETPIVLGPFRVKILCTDRSVQYQLREESTDCDRRHGSAHPYCGETETTTFANICTDEHQLTLNQLVYSGAIGEAASLLHVLLTDSASITSADDPHVNIDEWLEDAAELATCADCGCEFNPEQYGGDCTNCGETVCEECERFDSAGDRLCAGECSAYCDSCDEYCLAEDVRMMHCCNIIACESCRRSHADL